MRELLVTAHNGIELVVRGHGGEGPGVVFIHGVQRTLEDWPPYIDVERRADTGVDEGGGMAKAYWANTSGRWGARSGSPPTSNELAL